MKLNLGSHNKKMEGFVNVDALDLGNVDVLHDLTILPYPFEDGSAEEIYSCECLEHLPFKIAHHFLKECYRILVPCGTLTIQVPDIGKMCEMYANKQVCDCVPRKANKYEDYKADPNCRLCGGKALIHSDRWRVAFSGAQKHEYDAHLNHFTVDIMNGLLKEVGFESIAYTPNIYKLVLTATKHSLI